MLALELRSRDTELSAQAAVVSNLEKDLQQAQVEIGALNQTSHRTVSAALLRDIRIPRLTNVHLLAIIGGADPLQKVVNEIAKAKII